MDYFKHYSTASDSKSLNKVFDKFGHKGIAFWWMLVELCCENWDGKSEPEFVFHQRTVATKLKSSPNSVRPWLELCSTLDMCAFAHFETQFEIKIPKLAEVKTSRSVIKSNKNQLPVYIEEEKEENRIDLDIDAKKILPEVQPEVILKKSSPLSFLFDQMPEVQKWLNEGSHDTHAILVKNFSHHILAEEVPKLFTWAQKKSVRAESWMHTRLLNIDTKLYGANKGKVIKSLATPDNPTGDPYRAKLNEIRKKGQTA